MLIQNILKFLILSVPLIKLRENSVVIALLLIQVILALFVEKSGHGFNEYEYLQDNTKVQEAYICLWMVII